jgi:hypothetical protein
MAKFKDTAITVKDYFLSYFADGASSIDMGVNGSVTPVDFTVSAPAGYDILIGEISLYMEAGTAFNDTTFLNLPALTNGVDVIIDGNVAATFKTNLDVIMFMHEVTSTEVLGKLTRQMVAIWNANAGTVAKPLCIKDSITLRIQDDLSAAGIKFYAVLHGTKRIAK